MTDFSIKNGTRTRISTKTTKTNEYFIRFARNTVAPPISKDVLQYQCDGMFMLYICLKLKGEVQSLLTNENKTAEHQQHCNCLPIETMVKELWQNCEMIVLFVFYEVELMQEKQQN